MNLILSIPISLCRVIDDWTWLLEKRGIYWLRSGYRLISEGRVNGVVG